MINVLFLPPMPTAAPANIVPYTVEFDADLRMVVATHSGAMEAKDLRGITAAIVAVAREHRVIIALLDFTRMNFAADIVDIFNVPARVYPEFKVSRSAHIAVLMPPGVHERQAMRFYETASRNRGYQVSLFDSKAEAVKWLQQLPQPA